MAGAQTASGDPLSIVVHIDHNLATLVKDAFVVAQPLEALVGDMGRLAPEDPDLEWRPLDLAEVRKRIEDAADLWQMTYPPIDRDVAGVPAPRGVDGPAPAGRWIGARPAGVGRRGRGGDHPVPPRLAPRPGHRRRPGEPGRRALPFAIDDGPGDPLRWSPVAVEILLSDWLPRKVAADPGYLSKAPDLLRRLVRFAHTEGGIRPSSPRRRSPPWTSGSPRTGT